MTAWSRLHDAAGAGFFHCGGHFRVPPRPTTDMTATPDSVSPILPGAWLGMVGGGQLGRMFCFAA
ncbi:hypothetical protein D7S84_27175, partial [Ralstonia pickettii]|nr:hypothetical protein [Ralstonia pickettii]